MLNWNCVQKIYFVASFDKIRMKLQQNNRCENLQEWDADQNGIWK